MQKGKVMLTILEGGSVSDDQMDHFSMIKTQGELSKWISFR